MKIDARHRLLRGVPVIVVAMAILCLPWAWAAATTAPPAVEPVNVQRWEHLALTQPRADLGGELSAQIVRLGDEGWELVDVVTISKDGDTETKIYYFKRPKS